MPNITTNHAITYTYFIYHTGVSETFCFYRILNNENFKMIVEQTNFVTHLIITIQLYH